MQWFWLAALVLFIITEAATSALVSLWFIGGSLVSLLATILGAPIWAQVSLFIVVSVALLFALRPLMKKYVTPRKIVTNARANIGKTAIVTETIDNLHGTGAVKLAGVLWSARSSREDVCIEEGTLVCVTDIEGAKLCVEVKHQEVPV